MTTSLQAILIALYLPLLPLCLPPCTEACTSPSAQCVVLQFSESPARSGCVAGLAGCHCCILGAVLGCAARSLACLVDLGNVGPWDAVVLATMHSSRFAHNSSTAGNIRVALGCFGCQPKAVLAAPCGCVVCSAARWFACVRCALSLGYVAMAAAGCRCCGTVAALRDVIAISCCRLSANRCVHLCSRRGLKRRASLAAVHLHLQSCL